jgi:hypothetical protein
MLQKRRNLIHDYLKVRYNLACRISENFQGIGKPATVIREVINHIDIKLMGETHAELQTRVESKLNRVLTKHELCSDWISDKYLEDFIMLVNGLFKVIKPDASGNIDYISTIDKLGNHNLSHDK